MNRFILVVLDSFGIGCMDDVAAERKQDIGANTCLHILEKLNLCLPNLEKLGLMNALGTETSVMHKNPLAVYGKSKLLHYGADTFMGHQEIMGTRPQKPLFMPFSFYAESCKKALEAAGYKVKLIGENAQYLIVNDTVVIADNIEADYGQIYNITGVLDEIAFDDVIKIGHIIRKNVKVSRVIALGGEQITLQDLLDAVELHKGKYIGVNCGRSGVYNHGYQVIHMGYGVNAEGQIPTILGKNSIPVSLFGKVADIVANPCGKSVGCVDTAEVLQMVLDELDVLTNGFIAVNVQETDLAGHAQDTPKYGEKLSCADSYLGKIIGKIDGNDILLVMADHGNDPTAGSSHHTREYVPLLLYGKKLNKASSIGVRQTMSDVGATAADYFKVSGIESGESFLPLIQRQA